MNLTVAIPTYQSDLTACLAAIGTKHPILRLDNEFVGRDGMKSRSWNIGQVRNELCRRVTTEYIFFLDSDVICHEDPAKLIPLLTGNVGMVGYIYSRGADHVQNGAALLRTEVATRIGWNRENFCTCRNAAIQLREMGLTTLGVAGNVEHKKEIRKP